MPITINGREALDSYASCFECGGMSASNNRVRIYPIASHWQDRMLCTRCRNSTYDECAECHQLEYIQRMPTDDDGRLFCMQHSQACSGGCGTRGLFDYGVCNECGVYCEGHDGYFDPNLTTVVDGYCTSCEEENSYDRDPSDERHGVRGYGHTHPQRWYGGPLPKDERKRRVGYYMGIELEIYADREDARPILQWEADNNLVGFFDCKQDSSVQGFEIATQPFTPQFFETLVSDGRLASFFDMLNANYPLPVHYTGTEPEGHGLHVHIGKVAFLQDNVGLAAFSYLIGQDNGQHLERIARRSPTGYCDRVPKPVTQAIMLTPGTSEKQRQRLSRTAPYFGRSAINLHNGRTVEIRAFRSTRSAEELAAAVRLVYVAADYTRWLRSESRMRGVDPKRLAWAEFLRWVAQQRPLAFDALANVASAPKVQAAPPRVVPVQAEEFTFEEDEDEDDTPVPQFDWLPSTTVSECGLPLPCGHGCGPLLVRTQLRPTTGLLAV